MNRNHMELYRELGLNIAFYRKRAKLSQMKLAEFLSISRTHMSRIETAECAVSVDVLFDICKVLNIKPSQLFDFRE